MVQSLLAEFFGKESRRGVNPDEAIALGAAVQAGLKSGVISTDRGIMITDVCPFTLGVEVVTSNGFQKVGGMFSPIIPRNSTVPVSRTETYSTTAEGQRLVDIKVYQGESRLVKNNTFLDAYTVEGIPPGRAGDEKVAITFTYDVNGILKVSTKIVSTGKEASLAVDKSSQRMSEGERDKAKARLDKEWDAEPAGMGAAPVAPNGAVPNTAAPITSSKVLAAAERKLSTVSSASRGRLEDLVGKLRAVVTRGDAVEIRRLEEELTNLLFEID